MEKLRQLTAADYTNLLNGETIELLPVKEGMSIRVEIKSDGVYYEYIPIHPIIMSPNNYDFEIPNVPERFLLPKDDFFSHAHPLQHDNAFTHFEDGRITPPDPQV